MAVRKKRAKKKVSKATKKVSKATKKVSKEKAVSSEFNLTDIESELTKFGASLFDEDEPEERVNENAVPFRNLALQKITGGVYQGKFFEMAAQSQGGKSFHLYAIMGDAIKMGGYALLLDGERAMQEDYAKMMGLNIRSKRFMMAEKRTKTQKKRGVRGEPIVDVEEFFKLAHAFCKAIREHDKDYSHPIVIGIDSYPMLKTADDLEKAEKGKDPMGYASMQRASKFNVAMTTYLPKFDQLGASIVVLNQLTKRYDIMFGDPWESNGENKIKFNATQRLKGKLTGKIKDKKSKRQIGVKVEWECIKNRGVRPHQKVEVKIYYNRGIDPYSGLEQLLIDDETIRAATSGKDKGFKLLKDEKEFYPTIEELVEKNPWVLEPQWTKDIDDENITEEIENVDLDDLESEE
jgi:recombination protein RecA